MRDAQADVPLARRLRAQLAFKDSMVHGILQFTPSIAFRYVLHRCESRDIRCRESLLYYHWVPAVHRKTGHGMRTHYIDVPWRLTRRVFVIVPRSQPQGMTPRLGVGWAA